MNPAYLLLPHGLSILLYTAKDLFTRIGTTHSEMGPSILTINEGNAPTDASTKESDVTSP